MKTLLRHLLPVKNLHLKFQALFDLLVTMKYVSKEVFVGGVAKPGQTRRTQDH